MQWIVSFILLVTSAQGISKTFEYSTIQDVFYQTVLIQGDNLICTGFITHETQIATAAHCVANFKDRNPKIYFNAADINGKTLSADVSSFETHPLYKNEKQLSYDIAKITLKNSIPKSILNKLNTRKINLTSLPLLYETIYTLGYGLSQEALQNENQKLLEIQEPIFRIKQLNLNNEALQYSKEIMIYKNNLAHICTNDSGSPLIAQSALTNTFFLLGFTVAVLEKNTEIKTCADRVSFVNLDSISDWLYQ